MMIFFRCTELHFMALTIAYGCILSVFHSQFSVLCDKYIQSQTVVLGGVRSGQRSEVPCSFAFGLISWAMILCILNTIFLYNVGV